MEEKAQQMHIVRNIVRGGERPSGPGPLEEILTKRLGIEVVRGAVIDGGSVRQAATVPVSVGREVFEFILKVTGHGVTAVWKDYMDGQAVFRPYETFTELWRYEAFLSREHSFVVADSAGNELGRISPEFRLAMEDCDV